MSILSPGKPTGYFGAAFRLVETLTLMTIVLTAVLPILTRAADHDSGRHVYGLGRLVEVSLIVGAGLAVLTASGASAAIRILAGSSFDGSVPLLRALSVVLLLKFLTTAWSFGLLSVGSYRALLIANGAATVCSVVAGVVAIPLIGVYGGVVSTLAAELGLTVGYAFCMRRALPAARFPMRAAVVVGISAVVGASAIFLPLPDIVRPCVAILLYSALVLGGRVVPPEALALLPWMNRSEPQQVG
jgi:O-antigen/teichoic acid export membrane protein